MAWVSYISNEVLLWTTLRGIERVLEAAIRSEKGRRGSFA